MASEDSSWSSSERDADSSYDDDNDDDDNDDDKSLIQDTDELETTPASNGDNASHTTGLDSVHSSRSSTPDQEPPRTVTMTARAYQLEMLEESLKKNVIVAMDTGSGKTQVAIMRIQAELERGDKIAWFLAPTVSLAEQQFETIRAQIPGVQSRLILGSDNVEAWSSKPGVWDAVLFNTRIIVSTYQILFDAVTHALVPLASLGIIVVDEAHHSKGDNPVARLMREHYVPNKARGLPVPHILGLTASPLMTSNLNDLEVLEKTLDAVCKTPSKHREELMAQVNRPEMKIISYGGAASLDDAAQPTPAMLRLRNTCLELDIRQDPFVRRLLTDHTARGREKLKKVLLSKETYSRSQMESFCRRAWEMWKTFGPWAADYYIYRVISSFLRGSDNPPSQGGDSLGDQEWAYLAEAFRKLDAQPPPETPTELSPKVRALLDALESHEGNPIGIIFVKERASVAVLSHILAVHPKTSRRYRVGSMVGTSRVPGRRQDILDLSQKDYLLALQAFRKGAINLLVATSVLEEGIDVPACNLVICFDKPDNLKSFIQRRGRARMSASHLYLLVEDESDTSSRRWQNLEREMKRKYEDDMRENKRLEQIEDSDDLDYPILRDRETGAQITILDAKAHLEHFCATLSTRKYVDWSPFYVVHDLEGNPVDARQPGLRKATVHLPVSPAPGLRTFESLHAWSSEAKACKDAAFQAYAKLYEVGLVNRNMLPIRESDLLKDAEPRVGIVTVREQFNPWPLVAQAWRDGAPISSRRVTISSHDRSICAELELALPVPVPYMAQFDLYWDHKSAWLVRMNPDAGTPTAGAMSETDHTPALLTMAFGHRWRIQQQKQFPVRFTCLDRDIRLDDMSATEISPEIMAKVAPTHLVRDIANQHHPYFYLDWLPSKPAADLVGKPYQGFDDAPQEAAYVAVRSWPKKVGAFRPPRPNSAPTPCTKPYPRVLPADQVRADSIPAVYAHIAMFIPAITRALEVHLVAKDLLDTRLEPTGITDLSLVVAAISASAARGPTDYERIEFLGDAILKFCTTVNCSANYPLYPEGLLSPLKDKIVSNSRLFHAAVDFGLDRYIIHKTFTVHKWRPAYVEDLLENPPSETETRRLSTKTLADVVEALIGTSYISGGTPKALACISLFLPEFEWHSIEHCREVLYNQAPDDEPLPATMRSLESLLGYTFTKRSLLVEAMTHTSCNGPNIHASLDRLEFLGDAILDYVVVKALFDISTPTPLENSTLHLLRTTLVNADILAFLALEWAITQDGFDVDAGANTSVIVTARQTRLPLPSFLRHASPDLGLAQRATALRHAAMREQILQALWRGPRYPWSLLSRLQAQKFHADVVESLLGAVWVDSGDMTQCEAVAERIGILPLMRRLVADRVWLLHPKEELGMLAGSRPVQYLVQQVSEGEEAERLFRCEVTVDGEVVGRAEGAFSQEEARTRAAEEACARLKEGKED
ncbi:uncharacterized protein P884DRAFT_297448 [Thermothelomyces heterothallicus CBS 202.75]|uniref:uncharacterized protein n=1 Tax=Thermothelomyces heterothallicus CBS 202.75 TaxID=1149848 RepID=UPI0037441F06